MAKMLQMIRSAKGIDPVADAFAGTVGGEVYSMSEYARVRFGIYVGVGATGSSTVTVEACDNVTPSNTVAIPFWSREILTGDTESAIVRRAAAGYVYTVGSSKLIFIEASKDDMGASGYEFIRLKLVESVDSPVLAGTWADFMGGRYKEDINATVIV